MCRKPNSSHDKKKKGGRRKVESYSVETFEHKEVVPAFIQNSPSLVENIPFVKATDSNLLVDSTSFKFSPLYPNHFDSHLHSNFVHNNNSIFAMSPAMFNLEKSPAFLLSRSDIGTATELEKVEVKSVSTVSSGSTSESLVNSVSGVKRTRDKEKEKDLLHGLIPGIPTNTDIAEHPVTGEEVQLLTNLCKRRAEYLRNNPPESKISKVESGKPKSLQAMPNYFFWGSYSHASDVLHQLENLYPSFDLNLQHYSDNTVQDTVSITFLESQKFKLFRSYLDEFPIV